MRTKALAIAAMMALALLASRAQAPETPSRPELERVLHDAFSALGMLRGAQEEDAVLTVVYQGTGTGYAFGQAFRPGIPWPAFKIASYTADVSFDPLGMRVQQERTNPDGIVQGGGGLPFAAPQQQVFVVAAGDWADPPSEMRFAWNEQEWGVGATPSMNNATVRYLEARMLPQAALKAARAAAEANQTTVTVEGGRRVLTFPAADTTFSVRLNDQNQVDRVETRMDDPVLGDTVLEASYSDYFDLGGELHPSDILYAGHIVLRRGGHPVLDLRVLEGNSYNPYVVMPVPETVVQAAGAAEVVVNTQEVTEGVWYLTGGSHHSVAVEFGDYVALIEAPQNDERALAVLAAVRASIPNKPVRYLINTHHHFDHAGGLRAAASQGLTLVTQSMSKPYFEKVLAMPRTLNPDRVSTALRQPTIEGVDERRVIRDDTRTLELHRIQGSNHADTMLIAYLPNERILVEADIFTPPAANAPPPQRIHPESINLWENLERLGLDVVQILPIHGRLVSINDLRSYIGRN